jgi:hypothetical protein
MTILWTGDNIERYRHEKEQRKKTLRAEAIFAEKNLREKTTKASEEEKLSFEEKKRKLKLLKTNKKKYSNPLAGLEV